jgi:hypothetical protein
VVIPSFILDIIFVPQTGHSRGADEECGPRREPDTIIAFEP